MHFLESELDEKESLLVSVQRLKDEARGKIYNLKNIYHLLSLSQSAKLASSQLFKAVHLYALVRHYAMYF